MTTPPATQGNEDPSLSSDAIVIDMATRVILRYIENSVVAFLREDEAQKTEAEETFCREAAEFERDLQGPWRACAARLLAGEYQAEFQKHAAMSALEQAPKLQASVFRRVGFKPSQKAMVAAVQQIEVLLPAAIERMLGKIARLVNPDAARLAEIDHGSRLFMVQIEEGCPTDAMVWWVFGPYADRASSEGVRALLSGQWDAVACTIVAGSLVYVDAEAVLLTLGILPAVEERLRTMTAR